MGKRVSFKYIHICLPFFATKDPAFLSQDKDDISTILRDDLSDVMSLNVPDSTKTDVR